MEELIRKIKDESYVLDTSFLLHDVDQEPEEIKLSHHNEKLAIYFGLISMPFEVIRVFKNLKICGDSHNAIKFISNIIEWEIIVRDVKGFHHFKYGFYSCGGYW